MEHHRALVDAPRGEQLLRSGTFELDPVEKRRSLSGIEIDARSLGATARPFEHLGEANTQAAAFRRGGRHGL